MRKQANRPLLLLILMLVALFFANIAKAQDDTLDVGIFWQRLQQTDMVLGQAISQPDPTLAITSIKHLWDSVRYIRLQGSVIELNLAWLTQPLASGDARTLRVLHQQVRALLDFHAQETTSTSGTSLANLQEILKDPQFQYAAPTKAPSPIATPIPQNSTSAPGLSPVFSQLLLAAVGVAVVIIVFSYFVRSVRKQPAALISNDGAIETPTTATSALDLATDRVAAQDYRSAIRYLYLSSLLMLDERGMIAYNATLTNREHLAQMESKPQLREMLRQIINTFEDVWYGYIPVNATLYERYYERIQQLMQMTP